MLNNTIIIPHHVKIKYYLLFTAIFVVYSYFLKLSLSPMLNLKKPTIFQSYINCSFLLPGFNWDKNMDK